jgi:formylglycine-generating enzyme required for sulfatase activity
MTVGSAQAGPINVDLVPVGDPGNAADSSGFGAVAYPYSIGKYDVTTSQYAVFLNAVATTDTFGLWNSHMAVDLPTVGISRSGSAGSFTYSVIGNGNVPIFDETWGSAARFSNWLQNGQPTGVEGPGTTETGAYTLLGATSNAALMAVTRNAGATWFIPTEDEWYKAAYYKAGGKNAGYWTYPTQSNNTPSNVLSATGTNNANFHTSNGYTDPTNFFTSVGAFAASPGPYGTFDQGGNLFQWNETAQTITSRNERGGSFNNQSDILVASYRGLGDVATDVNDIIGFRVASVASVPEPSSVILLVAGIVVLAATAVVRRRMAKNLADPL